MVERGISNTRPGLPLRHFVEGRALWAERRFEMFQYRQVLVRLRQGNSNRDIARSGLMGRPKVARFRLLAESQA